MRETPEPENVTLRGRNRWVVPGLAIFYTGLTLCFGRDDAALYVIAVIAWTAAPLTLRMRVDVTDQGLRHVGFFRTRKITAREVTSVVTGTRWGASAPLVHVDDRRPFFLSALSDGRSRAEDQTTVLRRHLRRPHDL